MKVKNIKDIVLWLDQLKQYIDLQNQEIVKLIPQDKEKQFNTAIQELNSKLLEVQTSIPSIPDIPQPPDLTPIEEALSQLQDKVNSLQPNVTNVTEVTQVIKEEVDTGSIFEAFSNTISEVKQEILNLIPEVKDYDRDIQELEEKIQKIKDTPVGMTSIHRGASKLGQLGDVDTSGVTDNQVLKYNATTKKWEPQDDTFGGGVTTDFRSVDNKVLTIINGLITAATTSDFTNEFTNEFA